jgi:hypothetical protein
MSTPESLAHSSTSAPKTPLSAARAAALAELQKVPLWISVEYAGTQQVR